MAISGLIDHLAADLSMDKSKLDFSGVQPDPDLVPVYDRKYREFLRYQKILW